MTDVPDWAKDNHTDVPDWAQEEKPAAAKLSAGEPDMGAAASAWQGAKQGATFNMSDELAGAHAAGPEWAGKVPYAGSMLRTAIGAGKYLAGDEAAKTAYEKARDEERHANKLAEEQHPYWHGAGEVAGSIPAMAVLPEGALAKGAGLGARALQAAKVGAEYAGLSGAGEGETPTERLVNTAVGGASGFVGGAAAPVLGAAVQKVVSPLSSVVRGWFDSEGVSMQRVANALLKDNELIESGKVKGLTAEQWQQAIDRGDPVTIADLGGPHTQSLLRSAANTSPAARGVLENTFNGDRYETQAARVSQDIRDLISGGANAGKTRDQLIADYEHEASPRYIKSFEEGDRQILTPPMMGLMNNSPMFKKAMNDAVTSGADRAALMGINPAKPGAINLQYWDAVKKELDDVASSAFRAGDKNRGSIAAKMAERLRTELDNEVPSYKDTRGVAETFFKSKNALEAGEKAATQQNLSLDKLGQIMRKMSPAEADLFREGWASKWSDAILNTPNRRDPTAKILQSDNARARALKVFGEDGVNFIQARLDLEKIMDFQRKALGNSSTARQLIEAGLAGGAAGAVGEYFGGNEGGISGLVAGAASHRLPFAVHGTLAKGLTTGVRTVAGYVDRKVAAKVADLLVSQDMDKVREGVRMLSHTPQLRQNFNKLVRNISTSSAISSSPRLYLGRAPALTGPVQSVAGEEKSQGKALGGQVPNQDARHKAHGGSVTGRARAEKALPKDHQLGMRVPKGGSSCSSCHFLKSATECGNKGFQTWNGSAKLPAPKDSYCCDLYEHKTKRAAGGAINRALQAAKGYATGGSPFDWSGVGEAMPEYYGRGEILDPLAKAVVGGVSGLATLPQRAIGNSQTALETGNYNPEPVLEAATLPIGTGAIAGVPLRAGEAVLGSGFAAPLYHGSPQTGLSALNESARGPLGPGVYASPMETVAGRYAGQEGKVYELPQKTRDLFNGLGDRFSENAYEGWKNDKARLLKAAEPDKRDAIEQILDKTWMSDGYPMYARISQLYRGDKGAHELFKRAGFEGISGHVDGPEVLLFGKQPLTETGPVWRSAVEDTIASSPMKAAPAEQWAGTLKNAKGIKPEEMDWLGLNDFLASKAGQKVSKQELLDHVAGNQVELKDVVRGQASPDAIEAAKSAYKEFEDYSEALGEKYDLNPTQNLAMYGRIKKMDPAEVQKYEELQRRYIDTKKASEAETKYHSYQLPGGENYREHLLTMPAETKTISEWKTIRPDGHVDSTWTSEGSARRQAERINGTVSSTPKYTEVVGGYKSPHWDEPNVLAHVRSNDRMMESPEGPKKTLHLEEIQSDLHQKGRKEGYIQKYRPDELTEIPAGSYEASDPNRFWYVKSPDNVFQIPKSKASSFEEAKNYVIKEKNKGGGRIPDFPFKDTDAWSGLAMKRMIRHAAENGYDRISWTPGEAQAARYDLSKQVDRIDVSPANGGTGRRAVLIGMPDGHAMSLGVEKDGTIYNAGASNQAMQGKRLDDVVGKEMAEKIMNAEGTKTFQGEGLKVGGEGMREFYDKMLPKIAEKIGKAHGVKVKRGDLGRRDIVEAYHRKMEEKYGEEYISNMTPSEIKTLDGLEDEKSVPVHYFDIPPSLKQQAMKGMSMFQRGGRVKAKPNHAAAKGLEVARQYKRGGG